MSTSPLRYKKLITELATHKNTSDAVKAAGFSDKTAQKQSKRVIKSAVKYHAKELLKDENVNSLTTQQLMSELVGLSRSDLMNRLKFIATQDKDLSSALKVLLPLVKQHGVVLESSEEKITVPILNIVVDKAPDLFENGSTEPLVDAPEIVDVAV